VSSGSITTNRLGRSGVKGASSGDAAVAAQRVLGNNDALITSAPDEKIPRMKARRLTFCNEFIP
jgi:hypothetical protein